MMRECDFKLCIRESKETPTSIICIHSTKVNKKYICVLCMSNTKRLYSDTDISTLTYYEYVIIFIC